MAINAARLRVWRSQLAFVNPAFAFLQYQQTRSVALHEALDPQLRRTNVILNFEDDITAVINPESISGVAEGQLHAADKGRWGGANHSTYLTDDSEDESLTNQQVFTQQITCHIAPSVLRNISTRTSSAERPSDDESRFTGELGDSSSDLEARPCRKRRLSSIREFEFVYPLSQYDGQVPPLPISEERLVIEEFSNDLSRENGSGANASFCGEEYVEFDLVNFSIYLPGIDTHHGWEMRGLQDLATKAANSCYLVDGILTTGKSQRYVQGVPFKLCSIGNYGIDSHTVGSHIWIQSETNAKSDMYYRLKTPSPAYARYHQGFLWLANLAKHFVDYSQHLLDDGKKISIHNFCEDFARWLKEVHGLSSHFRNWCVGHNSPDFRRAISANINFLFKEAIGVQELLRGQPIWEELMTMTAIPTQPLTETLTVVTPYVYECFSHLKFGHILKKIPPVNEVEVLRKSRVESLQLTTSAQFGILPKAGIDSLPPKTHQLATEQARRVSMEKILDRKFGLSSIGAGDVLAVMKDGRGSLWKDEVSKWRTVDDCWYVYVQKVHVDKKNSRSFEVIWLYKPADTTCALMKYPYHNELFFSDNCSCSTSRILEDEVICEVSVAWNSEPGRLGTDFFIRQTYLHDNSFVTFNETHKQCSHFRDDHKTPLQDLTDMYKVGDTVLVIPPRDLKSRRRLEPGEILSINEDGVVVLRRLIRRHEFDHTSRSRPNELIYSNESFSVAASKVQRSCIVRFYTQEQVDREEVPAPYSRDGTGDAYYITTRIINQGGIPTVEQIKSGDMPCTLRQGFDPTSKPPRKPLRGMDMYCGGGNFGRGLEEGEAVHFDWAVDINQNAMHTYFANLKDITSTKLFLGSVDDLLAQALRGNPDHSPLIPLPGQVDFISAGNPCQGYSLLNSQRDSAKGLKNQSLVADVAAYIDFYRPQYALLENVISMAQKGRGRDEDVLSQLICCIVGMGYQIQLFNLDAWSFGSPQTRSRLFVSIAAPGAELPPHPALSHSHPVGTKDRGLGKMSNSQAFGNRLFPKYTPFEFVTAEDATKDLPDIGDGRTNHCTLYPDHRMAKGVKHELKSQMEAIPMFPPEMNFVKTWASGNGKMTQAERNLFPLLNKRGLMRQSVLPDSRAWERVNPKKLFPTIATSIEPACGRTGRTLHWEQQRLITVMEVRRAQGFPDHEVLTGIPSAQWRIVGNSVARTISMALGLSLRQAWLKNQPDEATDKVPLFATVAKVTSSRPSQTAKIHNCFQDTFATRLPKERNSSPEMSSDDATSSSRRHRRIMQLGGLKPSMSHSEVSSLPDSMVSSDQDSSISRKRRCSLPEHISVAEPKKRKLLGPASVRDPRTLWQPPAQQHQVSSLKASQLAREFPPVKRNGPLPKKPRVKVEDKRPVEIINLISDDDGDAEDEREDEDAEITSVRPKPTPVPYVPVDNTMFKPYEQTYARMRKPSPRQR